MTYSVLITGGAGYLGSMLANRLISEGYRVKVLDSLIFGGHSLIHLYGNPNFELVRNDIRNIDNLSKILNDVDIVVHLAAIVGEHLCQKIPKEANEINYTATKKLVAVCREKKIKKFIFSSTCSNYGDSGGKNHVDENSPLNPLTLYSKTKIDSENYIIQKTDEKFSGTILRFATLYGLSQRMRFDLLLHELLIDAITKNKITLYGSELWRPLLHIDDAVNAIFTTINAPLDKTNGAIFNVGNSNENYTKQELASMIKKIIPSTEIIINDEKKDLRNYKVSFNKIQNQLGYKTSKSVMEGITQVFQAINQKVIDPKDTRYNNQFLSGVNKLID